MKHHRPIILTVGAVMAVSALTFSTPARSDVATAVAAPTVPGCPDADGYTTATTIDELQPLYVGVWIRCSQTNLVPLGDSMGMELAGNGRWYRIYQGADGQLLRGQGIDHEGTWALLGLDGVETSTELLQLNLVSHIGFTHIGLSTLATTPEVLVVENSMDPAERAGFQRWTGAPPTSNASPSKPFTGCPAATGSRTFNTADEVITALTGMWIRCSTTSAFPSGWNAGEVGFEVTVDGMWYVLVLDQNGMPVRTSRAEQSGPLDVPVVGTGVQLHFSNDASYVSAVAAVFTEPAFLYLVGYPYVPAGYVPWDGNPLPIAQPSGTIPPTA